MTRPFLASRPFWYGVLTVLAGIVAVVLLVG